MKQWYALYVFYIHMEAIPTSLAIGRGIFKSPVESPPHMDSNAELWCFADVSLSKQLK